MKPIKFEESKISSISLSYDTLVNYQSTMGFWDTSSYSTIIAFISNKDLVVKDKMILTMIALHILNIKFSESKDEWKLIAKKANSWLKA